VFYWGAFNKLVAFWKNAEPPQIIPYPHNLAFRRTYRALGLSGSAAICTAAPRPIVMVYARIDNVILFVP